MREKARLAESGSLAFAPELAAALCGAEVFAFHCENHPMAGRRPSGLSLWRPGGDWLRSDPSEPVVAYLPSQLWIIGLGNLGQAFAWVLGSLPYPANPKPLLVLQDFDRVMESNVSTSLLTAPHAVGRKKARVVADWAEARGFDTVTEERRFGPCIRRGRRACGCTLRRGQRAGSLAPGGGRLRADHRGRLGDRSRGISEHLPARISRLAEGGRDMV